MVGYLLFALFLIVGVYGITNSNLFRNQKKAAVIYAAVVIILFCGSIDAKQFGGDIMNYYNHAERALKMSYADYLSNCPFEEGYAYFIWHVSNAFGSAQALLFVQYAFVNIVILVYLYKYSEDLLISITFYICIGGFTFYLTAFRQAFAMAIGLIAFMIMKRGRIIHYIIAALLIAFALLFHKTVIVFFVVLLINKFPLKTKTMILFFVFSAIIFINLNLIVDYANEQIERDYSTYKGTPLGGIINIVIFSLILLLFNLAYRDNRIAVLEGKSECNEMDNYHSEVFLSVLCLTIYSLRFYVLALERVSFYFIIPFSVLISVGIKRSDNNKVRMLTTLTFVVLSIVLFLERCNNTFGNYVSIWSW